MNAAKGLVLLYCTFVSLPMAPAQESAKPKPDGTTSASDGSSKPVTEAQRLDLERMKRTAASYRIATDSERPKDLVLSEEPILRWSNPVRDTVAGAVFVWLADGRPQAVASVYRYGVDGRVEEENEFQSLATTGLTAIREGRTVWAPRTAGIEFAPIPGAPRPAATSAERLRQLRSLAREFHAYFDSPEDRSELRLLPKPLVRYEANRADLSDGALFAFVLTTDPEVLLLIESRPVSGVPTWHYGFARMSMVLLRAAHKNRSVWKAGWAYELRNPSQPYFSILNRVSPD